MLLLGCWAVALPVPAARAAPDSDAQLESDIAKLVADADLGDEIGISVVDLQSGRTLYEHHAGKPLNPASNMKLLTAAAALRELGAEFRIRTGVYGRVEESEVRGGLYLKGFGDPTLEHRDLLALALELRDRGIRAVDEVFVDGSYFDDKVLPPAYEQQPHEKAAFRAPISAASVDRSAYTLTVRPGPEVGAPALVALDAATYFELDNELKTSASGAPKVIAIQRAADGKLSLKVRGSVPITAPRAAYRRRVADPQAYAGHAMIAALRTAGIRVPPRVSQAPTPQDAALLAWTESAPLSTMLYSLGKLSDNFVAEMLLKIIGAERRRRPGRSADGAGIVLGMLRQMGIDDDGVRIVNGSGLFDGNLIAASHVTKVLQHMYADPGTRPEYLSQLALGGVDGTLQRRLRDLPRPRIVRAKTGTLADVIALSGYVFGPNPRRAVAFSVLANGIRGHQHAARNLADAIVTAIAEWRF